MGERAAPPGITGVSGIVVDDAYLAAEKAGAEEWQRQHEAKLARFGGSYEALEAHEAAEAKRIRDARLALKLTGHHRMADVKRRDLEAKLSAQKAQITVDEAIRIKEFDDRIARLEKKAKSSPQDSREQSMIRFEALGCKMVVVGLLAPLVVTEPPSPTTTTASVSSGYHQRIPVRARNREHCAAPARRRVSPSASSDDPPSPGDPPLALARHPRLGLVNPALARFLADAEAVE